MKRFIKAALLGVIAIGSLALVMPTPTTDACIRCLIRQCPPCTRLGRQTCYICPRCEAIPGCQLP